MRFRPIALAAVVVLLGSGSGAGVASSVGRTDDVAATASVTEPAVRGPRRDVPTPADLIRDAVFDRINAARAAAGLPPVRRNAALEAGAQAHSADMAWRTTLTHAGPNGESPYSLIVATGYPVGSWAMNVARGQNTAADVMAAWMASSPHRANILNSSVTEVGIGLATAANGVRYWTLWFASPRG